MCREPPPGHVFVGSLAEIDPSKVAEVVRGSRHTRSLQYSAIRSDIGSPIIKIFYNIFTSTAWPRRKSTALEHFCKCFILHVTTLLSTKAFVKHNVYSLYTYIERVDVPLACVASAVAPLRRNRDRMYPHLSDSMSVDLPTPLLPSTSTRTRENGFPDVPS